MVQLAVLNQTWQTQNVGWALLPVGNQPNSRSASRFEFPPSPESTGCRSRPADTGNRRAGVPRPYPKLHPRRVYPGGMLRQQPVAGGTVECDIRAVACPDKDVRPTWTCSDLSAA